MLKKRWFSVLLHVLAWVLFFVVPGIMNSYPDPHHGGMHGPRPMPMPAAHSGSFWFYFSTLKNLLLIPLFYLNIFYVLPKYLPARRYGMLVLVEVTLALFQFFYTLAISGIIFPGTHGGPDKYLNLLAYLIVVSIAFVYYAFKESLRIEKMQKERETESLKTELQFLRWQISPHFLFNALNNMVSLARKKSDILEPMLINLSGLMRYMLYETAGSIITLNKEAQYLESYIDLQSIRYDNVQMDILLEVPESPVLYIEPMLLLPFVENAFKHGIDNVPSPVIRVDLNVVMDELHFMVLNKNPEIKSPVRDDAHGVGLINVMKRLDLIYPGRHTLDIRQNDWFEISLKITLG